MKWIEWKELVCLEELASMNAEAQGITIAILAPDTVEEPNWKRDDSESGHIRDGVYDVNLSNQQEVFGHQRPC